VAPNIFSVIITVAFPSYKKIECQLTCADNKTLYKGEVRRSLQNCGSSVWILPPCHTSGARRIVVAP